MRSEKEMMELILNTAKEDERIRAVYMGGSRANLNAKKDWLQDYDIYYVVNDLPSFLCNDSWLNVFGSRIMMQKPEDMELIPPARDGRYGYLMLFEDFNRIDLNLIPVDKQEELLSGGSPKLVLLNKDNMQTPIPGIQMPDAPRPSSKLYLDCCNEFWWVTQNVAKGILRKEEPYAIHMLEQLIYVLEQMMRWWIGVEHGEKTLLGKYGKYMKPYFSHSCWKQYLLAFPNPHNLWDSLFSACSLFRILAVSIGDKLNYEYPLNEDAGMMKYLTAVRKMEL